MARISESGMEVGDGPGAGPGTDGTAAGQREERHEQDAREFRAGR
jgi:hypothetical protein